MLPLFYWQILLTTFWLLSFCFCMSFYAVLCIVSARKNWCKKVRKPLKPKDLRTFSYGCGGRIWTYDLRVMSPTSYQAAPLRDIMVPETGLEPVRVLPHGILSPGRLPIPPLRHVPLSATLLFYHILACMSIPFCKNLSSFFDRGFHFFTRIFRIAQNDCWLFCMDRL